MQHAPKVWIQKIDIDRLDSEHWQAFGQHVKKVHGAISSCAQKHVSMLAEINGKLKNEHFACSCWFKDFSAQSIGRNGQI